MPRRTSQHDWNRFSRAATKRGERITNGWLKGDLTTSEWKEQFQAFVEDRHGYAGYLGRRRGGDFSPRHDGDRDFGKLAGEDQTDFIARFADDLDKGRYLDPDTHELNKKAILDRAGMYVHVMRGTANEAFAGVGFDHEYFNWDEGETEDHCRDCPEIAANSPYHAVDLPSYPGDGSTECLGSCLCNLVRMSDGLRGFGRAA